MAHNSTSQRKFPQGAPTPTPNLQTHSQWSQLVCTWQKTAAKKKRYKIKPRKAIRKFTTFHTHYTLWVFTFFYISFLAKTAVCRCHAPGVQVRPCEIRVQLPRDFWVFVCKFSFLVPTLFFSSSVFFFALALGKFRCCRRRLFSTPVDLGLAWSCPMRKTYNSTVAEIFQSYR